MQIGNVSVKVHRELMNKHIAHTGGVIADLTQHNGKDFGEALKQLQACRGNKTRLEETMKTVLGTTDFGETYDTNISTPDGFIDRIWADQDSLRNVRGIPTSAAKIDQEELTLGSAGEDVLRPGVEGTDPGDTGTLDTANREFVLEELIGIFGITDKALEDNIEGGTVEDHIMRMFLDAFGNGIAKAAWNGTMIGTTNSQRGSVTACFDGFIQQLNDGGNIVYATGLEDRYISSIQENDKFLAAIKLLGNKYSNQNMVWATTRGIMADWNAEIGQRETGLGDSKVTASWKNCPPAQSVDFFHVPALRTDYLVKGTGVVQVSSPLDTQLAAIGKSRLAYITTDAITNAANAQVHCIGCDAAGSAFQLNAELLTQSGTASGTRIDYTTALVRDHAIDEYVTEYSTSPDDDGEPCALTGWDNLTVYYQRQLRVETYRQPRERQTYFIVTIRLVPIVIDQLAGVLIRDILVR